MITLKKISLPQLVDSIRVAYENDIDLFEQYHIKKTDFDSAVQITFKMIQDTSKIKKLFNYSVIYNKNKIGYITTYDGNVLYSYAIAVKYRKRNILIDWWRLVEKTLGVNYITMLYDNNIRAMKFLERNGLKKVRHFDNIVIYEK